MQNTSNPNKSNLYFIIVNFTNNCTLYDTINIGSESILQIPNVLKLNSQKNNLFGPSFNFEKIQFESYSLSIFDRYGQQIFYANDPSKSWDGSFNNKFVEIGVYAYFIIYKLKNENIEKIHGDITVLR